jgi:hypothetical protein
MSSRTHARSKLADAVEILETHQGDVRQRLAAAWHHLLGISPACLPHSVKTRFTWAMTTIQKGAGGAFGEQETRPLTLPHITAETGNDIARILLDVRNALENDRD